MSKPWFVNRRTLSRGLVHGTAAAVALTAMAAAGVKLPSFGSLGMETTTPIGALMAQGG